MCNLKCRYCPREELVQSGKRPKKLMALDEFEHVLAQLETCPILDVKLHGLSEALMIKNFQLYVAIVKRYFPKAHVIVVTNHQYNLDKSAFMDVFSLVDEVWLSFDGVGKMFEHIRTGAVWKKSMVFLERLKALVSEEDRRTKIHIQCTVSCENYLDLPKVYELKELYGLSSVRLNLAQEWKGDQLSSHGHEADHDLIEYLKKNFRNDLKGVGGWEYKDCFWPYEGVFIDAYGDIRHCIMNYTMPPIGNVFSDDLRTIYNESRVYKDAREKLAKNCPPNQCETCDYAHLSSVLTKIHGKPAYWPSRKFEYQKVGLTRLTNQPDDDNLVFNAT